MQRAVVDRLRCPVCTQSLVEVTEPSRALRCGRGHAFDLARQGYVNLLAGRAVHDGDTAPMVAAREEFLKGGHYAALSAALAAATRRHLPPADPVPLVVDAGGGTGRHLAAVLKAVPEAVGLVVDASKPALRRAARVHARADAALADTWRAVPLANGAAAVLLNVFAPRNGPEFRRVLRPDGALLVVTPEADHLRELVTALDLLRVDPEKAERIAAGLADWFAPGPVHIHRNRLALSRAAARALVAMGPSAWHADRRRLDDRLAALPEPIGVSVAVRLAVYRPR